MDALAKGAYVPAAQFVQLSCPDRAAYRPTAQASHPLTPLAAAKAPAAQATQLVELAPPVAAA